MFNVTTVRANKSAEIVTWQNRVIAAGGGFESNSLIIANNLLTILHGKSYYTELVYLLPMLGVGMGAARTPLIDKLNVGSATNTAFLDANFSQSTGLQGNGSTKYLNSLIKPSQLGITNNGGMGYWENNISFSANTEPMGMYANVGSDRFVVDLRSTLQAFRWGIAANGASIATTAVNAHYYGQRFGATSRQIFRGGSLLATNTTSDATSGAGNRSIIIVGSDESSSILPWPGRCALAYMTNGNLSTEDISDFDSVLKNYLMIPTGKPQS